MASVMAFQRVATAESHLLAAAHAPCEREAVLVRMQVHDTACTSSPEKGVSGVVGVRPTVSHLLRTIGAPSTRKAVAVRMEIHEAVAGPHKCVFGSTAVTNNLIAGDVQGL